MRRRGRRAPAGRLDWKRLLIWLRADNLISAADADPQADLNASIEYRQHLARVLTRRALDAASA